ncbi:hypothetical protein [Sphingomonas aerophila]|nr:hypothetical protein [Sphingomonas aerophila]
METDALANVRTAAASAAQATAARQALLTSAQQASASGRIADSAAALPFVEQRLQQQASAQEYAAAKALFIYHLRLILDRRGSLMNIIDISMGEDGKQASLATDLETLHWSAQSDVRRDERAFSGLRYDATIVGAVSYSTELTRRLSVIIEQMAKQAKSDAGVSAVDWEAVQPELEAIQDEVETLVELNSEDNHRTPKPGPIVLNPCTGPTTREICQERWQ